MLELVEKYITLGGENPLTGYPVYIIRFTGCNLNCIYCDTKYRNESNIRLTDEQLICDIHKTVNDYPFIKILFTGGEPLINGRQNKLIKIIKNFKNSDFYIETNGSLKIDDFETDNCHYAADWKSPSSGNEHFCIENLKNFRKDRDCIKFVINENDFNWIKNKISVINKINPGLPVFVSGQWDQIQPKDIADLIITNRLPAALNMQIHKIIWDDKTRGI